jgi:hypothetical protein
MGLLKRNGAAGDGGMWVVCGVVGDEWDGDLWWWEG